jgi:hypothetical protein
VKKKKLLRTVSLFSFFMSLILIYVWIYIFPSIKKVNILKREIRQLSQKTDTARNEGAFFIPGDKKESRLLHKAETVFKSTLGRLRHDDPGQDRWQPLQEFMTGASADCRLKNFNLVVAGSQAEDADENTATGFPGTGSIPTEMTFTSDPGSALRFISRLPEAPVYILIRKIDISRAGRYLSFRISAEILHVIQAAPGDGESKESLLTDMNSPLLRRPVYLSPIRLKEARGGKGEAGE